MDIQQNPRLSLWLSLTKKQRIIQPNSMEYLSIIYAHLMRICLDFKGIKQSH